MKRIVMSVCLAAAVATAGVIVVPDDYPTIQAGLNAAAYGDTVLVMSGTYPENITWPARDGIRLYSADGPAATVIDGGGNGRVIDIVSSSIREASELRGFTITGGRMDGSSGYGTMWVEKSRIQRALFSRLEHPENLQAWLRFSEAEKQSDYLVRIRETGSTPGEMKAVTGAKD